MEYLRQIEEDLQNISNEAGKKYPEVLDASNNGLHALKIIRETYVSEIRKRDNSNVSVKFKHSSEVVAPYILVCNHVESSQKLMGLSINGLLMLLKYDIVPPSEVQNILRVLQIQVHSPKCEFHLKILQLLVHLVTLLAHDTNNYNLLSEQTIATFLTISLSLTDSKHPASITTAALGTTRQIIAIIMDAITVVSKDMKSLEASVSNAGKDAKEKKLTEEQQRNEFVYIWILQSSTLIVREMSLFMQGSTSSLIKLTHVISQTFAMDVIYDILNGWKELFHSLNSLKLQLHNSVIPSLQVMLKNIHSDFHSNHQKFGLTTASSHTARIIQIVRFILLEFWLTDDSSYDDYEHIITLLIHGMLPMRELPSDPFDEAGKKGQSKHKPATNSTTSASDDLMGLRNRIEEASSIISKFSPFPLGSAISGKPLNASASGGNTAGKNQSGNNSAEQEAYIQVGRSSSSTGLLSSALFAQSSERLLPAHPAACCLEVLLSLLLCRSVNMLKTDMGMRCLLNLISQLTIHSSNLVINIFSNEQNAK